MATKTPSITLPPTVPASINAPTPAPKATKAKVHDFAAWKAELDAGYSAAGYDPKTSPIHGQQDADLLARVRDELDILASRINDPARLPADNARDAEGIRLLVDQMLRRKVGKIIAGQTYAKRK